MGLALASTHARRTAPEWHHLSQPPLSPSPHTFAASTRCASDCAAAACHRQASENPQMAIGSRGGFGISGVNEADVHGYLQEAAGPKVHASCQAGAKSSLARAAVYYASKVDQGAVSLSNSCPSM